MFAWLIAAMCVSVALCGWTQKGGDASRNATQGSLGRVVSTQGKVAWNVSAPFAKVFFGSPVVDDVRGRVFIAGADGYVYAFSAANGTRLWRVCFGKHGAFPSSPCTGYEPPQGIDSTTDPSWYLNVNGVDGSVVLTARLADQTKEPPYGYSDKRAAIVCLNGTNGATLWTSVTGLFNPLNGDSSSVSRLLLVPSGDIYYWQTSNGTVSLVRMDMHGRVIFNSTGSGAFSWSDEMTYVAEDDSIWTNVKQVGGLAKLKASDGSIVTQFQDNILDSMGLPFPMVYDRRNHLMHFGRQGQNQGYALDARSGDPVWEIPCTDAGWPTSAVLCGKDRVVFFSDDALMAAWDPQSAENQKPLWQVALDDPPQPARQLIASLDSYIIVDYGFALYMFDCDGKMLWKKAFNSCDEVVSSGVALGNNEIFWNTCAGLFKVVA